MKKSHTAGGAKLRRPARSQVQPGKGGGKPLGKTISRRLLGMVDRNRETTEAPRVVSFLDFLTHHAQVKSGAGYIPYNLAGREALRPIVERLDEIIDSGMTDASVAICGGAQFGKTALMLNLLAFLVAVCFRNVGYYLPDDDLVSGLVDGKLRPDVLDQIPWLARMIAVGKTLNATGRAVNRKGAFLCTDGKRTALAFMRGLGKIPTSFSMDVVVQDEKDDLPEEHARFLSGRMTASNLRLSLLIGTQRYHGAGQNLAFTEGTQHIGLLTCTGCGEKVNPETAWPGVCRLMVDGAPSCEWPRLTKEGHFSSIRAPMASPSGGPDNSLSGWPEATGGDRECAHPPATSCSLRESGQRVVWTTPPAGAPASFSISYSPGQQYALCCPDCGARLDRDHPEWHALAPERGKLRRWSYRISQLLIPAIDLEQIVAAWQLAIRDPEQMTVFCTDRLALPKSTTQTLTPAVLEAARGDYVLGRVKGEGVREKGSDSESTRRPFSLFPSTFSLCYGGLDMGDQCWFVARAVDAQAPHLVRLLWAEPIAAERVRTRVPELFYQLGLRALCVDAGPLRDLARDLVFILNGLDEDCVCSSGDGGNNIYFRSRGSEVAAAGPSGGILPESVALTAPPLGTAAATCAARIPIFWHAASQKWRHARAMAVEFTQREGHGLRHKLARTQGGRLYPLLAANRDETIQRVVQELLPPEIGDPRLIENPDGTAACAPTQRFFLPRATEETREVLDIYERHLLAGARQERSADGRTLRYLDKCENHFLLATAYAALAETLVTETPAVAIPAIRPLPSTRPTARSPRSLAG